MQALRYASLFDPRTLGWILLTLWLAACKQVSETPAYRSVATTTAADTLPPTLNRAPMFPQIHANLQGMVSEFVRSMYHDSRGQYWFGTNADGIIRYDGHTLERMAVPGSRSWVSVRAIVEDRAGQLWFGTSDGLVKYDGTNFTLLGEKDGLPDEEIWGLTIDQQGLMWIGTIGGACHFDGKQFVTFELPETMVDNPEHMLSDKLVRHFMEDKNGVMWLVTDGNGIFKYHQGEFTHLTDQNGLTDNNVADVLEDREGNIWIGTYYGGVSRYDGATYTHFTQDGQIAGIEVYNFCEDAAGKVWFSAENLGVYVYDGAHFTQYTSADGLTNNGIQSIMADHNGQLWFGSWQGLCIYDGKTFKDAAEAAPWTR